MARCIMPGFHDADRIRRFIRRIALWHGCSWGAGWAGGNQGKEPGGYEMNLRSGLNQPTDQRLSQPPSTFMIVPFM
jgi:hypothetical protein